MLEKNGEFKPGKSYTDDGTGEIANSYPQKNMSLNRSYKSKDKDLKNIFNEFDKFLEEDNYTGGK